MRTVVVDCDSGNLHSVVKSFQRVAGEMGVGEIVIADRPEALKTADRIVLPGVGAFADCRRGLAARPGLYEAMEELVIKRGIPFLGICVGMQLMADLGREEVTTPGFGWIAGEVRRIRPADPALKVPHMGWNDLRITMDHPVLAGIGTGDHAYFVHSFQFVARDAGRVAATVEHGGPITAALARDNLFGTQFHPEKSQATGLRLIGNFLRWRP